MVDDVIGRALEASAGYLTRQGWADVRVEGNEDSALLVGHDQGEFVAVFVTVDSVLDGPPSVVPRISILGYNRVDHISIKVIAPDRALLRHHRAVQ